MGSPYHAAFLNEIVHHYRPIQRSCEKSRWSKSNRRSSRTAVSMQQCVMPILARKTVVSSCAILNLMAACKAIGAQLLPLNIG